MSLRVAAPIVEAGLLEALTAASASGDTFENTGKEFVTIANGHATLPRTVTIDVPNTDNFGVAGSALDRVIVIAALSRQDIGPFRKNKFNNANNLVTMTYSSETDLTLQVKSFAAAI